MSKKQKTRQAKTAWQLLSPPDETQISKLTDWLELSSWLQNDKKISRSEIVAVFNFQSDNDTAESMVNDIWSEIKNRVFSLKEKYPFELSKNEEIFSFKKDSNNPAYVFCLLISYIGLDNGANKMKLWKVLDISVLFEELCECVANKYISDSFDTNIKTATLRFGSPRKSWEKQKRPLESALKELVNVIGDGESIVSTTRNTARIRGDGGDGGLDVIAIRKFNDERQGVLVFLGQCAMANGKSEYEQKINDLNNFLTEIVRFDFPYLMAFFLPHVLSHSDADHKLSWEKIKRHRNIPFDRIRIANYGCNWQSEKIDNLFASCQKKMKKDYKLV